MRPFLALDTATDHIAVAVGDLDRPGAVIQADDFRAPRAANTVVLTAVERLVRAEGLEMRDIVAVVCGRGPGSFTGVRIGVATAKGLAHGLGVFACGVGTLDAVASRPTADGLVGVIGDAMRQEVYPALFRLRDGRAERLTPDRVTRPELAAAEWESLGEPLTLTGWGLTKHGALFEAVLGEDVRVAEPHLWVPDGASLIAAAWTEEGPGSLAALAGIDQAEAFRVAHPAVLLPVYTRLSDAEEAERRTGGGATGMAAGGVAGPGGGGSS
ncbi:MAG: tRNA (adenosine(37)-N6)-threonylcarbamoyltransferase complex dimerization subunit type 1 TsaB [Coriobacteriia bacterium]|nr:tRNA (adenosine(37)-N6)-threonylcarbamoyltransferase complex dimerization subunit type 1 TsaB [Coriobacteriia bacterium]